MTARIEDRIDEIVCHIDGRSPYVVIAALSEAATELRRLRAELLEIRVRAAMTVVAAEGRVEDCTRRLLELLPRSVFAATGSDVGEAEVRRLLSEEVG
jgi:hypothetical protein